MPCVPYWRNMKKSLLNETIYVSLDRGALKIRMSVSVGPKGNQRYCNIFECDLSGAPNAMCPSPKDVEFLCGKMAEAINAIWKEEAKQRADKESCPAILIDDNATDLERMVAGVILEAENV